MVVERKPCVRGEKERECDEEVECHSLYGIVSTPRTNTCRVGVHCGIGMNPFIIIYYSWNGGMTVSTENVPPSRNHEKIKSQESVATGSTRPTAFFFS